MNSALPPSAPTPRRNGMKQTPIPDDACVDDADLALSLDRRVITALSNLAAAIESTDFDFDQVPSLDIREVGEWNGD